MTNEEIKRYYHGAYRFAETDDGYIYGIQYTPEQMEYLRSIRDDDFFYVRAYFGCSKTLEFITEATEASFDYKFRSGCGETIDLAIDGIIYESHIAKDLGKCGRITFKLPKGRKNVTVYLTADDVTYIKDLVLNAPAEPVVKDTKVLWMGDSITQGYGPFRSGETYVNVANRRLGYEVLNQGIGGYFYDKNILEKMEGYRPDKIITAHGTNQCLSETREKDVREYFDRLEELYPDTKVLVITPVWRGNFSKAGEYEKTEMFIDFCNKIRIIAEKHPNVTVIDGFKLMHHSKEYYMEDWLHPNALGCEVYGRSLAEEIKRIGF